MMLRRPKMSPVDFDTTPKTETDKALHEALRSRLREIVEQPLTARSLVELEQVAGLARSLIVVGKAPQAGAQRALPDSTTNVLGAMVNASQYDLSGLGGLGVDTEYGSVLAASPRAETFGASVARELIAGIGKISESFSRKESKSELVEALAAAKKAGLVEIAAKFEKQLLGEAETMNEKLTAKKAEMVEDEKAATRYQCPKCLQTETSCVPGYCSMEQYEESGTAGEQAIV